MFSLRFQDDGSPVRWDSCSDCADTPAGQRWLCRNRDNHAPADPHHMTTARNIAQRAAASGRAVEVVAGDKVRLVIQPSGSAAPPEGVTVAPRSQCVRDERTCFCPACRAERKGQA